MRLTLPATRKSPKEHLGLGRLANLVFLLGLALLVGFSTLATESYTLDLRTKPDARPWLRAPGSGVISGPGRRPQYALPLAATIGTVKPATIGWDQTFIIEVIVRNNGTATFYLPRFRDPWKVHTEGNKGRRTLLFFVQFSPPDQGETVRSLVAMTVSADTVPKSTLELAPKQSLRVLLPVDLATVREKFSLKTRDVTFRVVLQEWTLEDDRYFIKALSEDLESANAATVAIRKEKSAPQH